MSAPGPGQSSVAKAGWLIALLFFGWLAFLFVPAPKPESKPAPPSIKPPPSRLVALGLPDNIDFERLPEYFALYAEEAEWKNGRTIFAYWNPGSNSYSYFFEATRNNGKQSFRLISKFEAYRSMTHENDSVHESEDVKPSDADIAAIKSIAESPTHPMVLFHSYPIIVSIYERPPLRKPAVLVTPSTVPLDMNMKLRPLPKIEIKDFPIPDEPTKK